eukprot:9864758-Lingulodinium_polyedra.AAC.1
MQVRTVRERGDDQSARDGGDVAAAELAFVGHEPAEGEQRRHGLLLAKLDVWSWGKVRSGHVAK